eukprot:Rmarinus@m.21051
MLLVASILMRWTKRFAAIRKNVRPQKRSDVAPGQMPLILPQAHHAIHKTLKSHRNRHVAWMGIARRLMRHVDRRRSILSLWIPPFVTRWEKKTACRHLQGMTRSKISAANHHRRKIELLPSPYWIIYPNLISPLI